MSSYSFSKFLVNKRKNLVKNRRLAPSRPIALFTIVNIIHFCVYIMLLIDRLTGGYFTQNWLNFLIFCRAVPTLTHYFSTPPHSLSSSSHPNNHLIPTIFPFSAILLPYLYSKLPYPYLTPYIPLFSTSLYTSTHTILHIYSNSQSTKTLQTP